MKNKKGIALIISLLLIVGTVLPGTLAVSLDQSAAAGEFTLEEAEKTCTCGAAEGAAHGEDCPQYTAPEKAEEKAAAHAEGCTDGCTAEGCKCACHLFDRIMACKTLEEIYALIEATPEEELTALTEEQAAQAEAKIAALEPAPLPAIVIGESEPPVASEVGYETVSYTNVAPLGEPITGQHK